MLTKPSTAIRVADLDRSIHFYIDQIGCTLGPHDRAANVAQVSYAGYPVLLAGPDMHDLSPFLVPTNEVLSPGATIFFNGGPASEIQELRSTLEARGVVEIELIERYWGDRILNVRDPDGYTISFWTSIERPQEESLVLYEAGPDSLEETLADIPSEDLDIAHSSGAWTIRQIVHHIADSEATVLARTKFGLAEPGRIYHPNPYSQDIWAIGLDYAGRDIGPSVALFRAIRGHISQIMRQLPDAWDRYTVSPDGTRFAAGQMIPMLVSHACEHIEEIKEIRNAGCTGKGSCARSNAVRRGQQ